LVLPVSFQALDSNLDVLLDILEIILNAEMTLRTKRCAVMVKQDRKSMNLKHLKNFKLNFLF
jgi:hypothetical protein